MGNGEEGDGNKVTNTGWLWWSHTFVGLTMILVIPLLALFCLGRWDLTELAV